MSDMFDHEADAWGSLDQAIDEGFQWGRGRGRGRRRERAPFCYDPLYYHTLVHFLALEAQTEKAYLLRLSKSAGVWVPKSACRSLKKGACLVYVHTATYRQCRKVDLSPVSDGFEVLD